MFILEKSINLSWVWNPLTLGLETSILPRDHQANSERVWLNIIVYLISTRIATNIQKYEQWLEHVERMDSNHSPNLLLKNHPVKGEDVVTRIQKYQKQWLKQVESNDFNHPPNLLLKNHRVGRRHRGRTYKRLRDQF